MKFAHHLTRRLLFLPFSSSSSSYSSPAFRNVSGLAGAWIAREKYVSRKSQDDPSDTLFGRVVKSGEEASVAPLLDDWVREGRSVDTTVLKSTIRELRACHRYKHALEVSLWMSNKASNPGVSKGHVSLSAGDIAMKLDLISRVHGIEQAEEHFNALPEEYKEMKTHSALLHCYTRKRLVEKAEALFLKMRDLDICRSSLCYSSMCNLYYQTGDRVKLESLVQEMEKEGVKPDNMVCSILISMYGREHNFDAVEKIIAKVESEILSGLGPSLYISAAASHLKAGLVDKGVEYLRKAEKLIPRNRRNTNMSYFLSLYSSAGRKDDVLRIWRQNKKYKVFNKDYMWIIPALMKLDEFEAAEHILGEWESTTGLLRDVHVPNLLIREYSKKGLVEKADSILIWLKSKGLEPNSFTWSYISAAYIQGKQMPEAVEAAKSALRTHTRKWKPIIEHLAACLNYLIAEEDMESLRELASLLRSKEFISDELHDMLLALAMDKNQVEDALKEEFNMLL